MDTNLKQEFSLLARARCECVTEYKSWNPSRMKMEDRVVESWQCLKPAVWLHELSGRLVCGAHHVAMMNRRKPVRFVDRGDGVPMIGKV